MPATALRPKLLQSRNNPLRRLNSIRSLVRNSSLIIVRPRVQLGLLLRSIIATIIVNHRLSPRRASRHRRSIPHMLVVLIINTNSPSHDHSRGRRRTLSSRLINPLPGHTPLPHRIKRRGQDHIQGVLRRRLFNLQVLSTTCARPAAQLQLSLPIEPR